MTDALNTTFYNTKFSIMESLWIVTVILKLVKASQYITNSRPLTLLNTFYKIISYILASRLKPVLDRILGAGQINSLLMH